MGHLMRPFLIFLALTAGLGGALAQDEVGQRQDLMKEIAGAMNRINRIFRGQEPYDGETLRKAAEVVQSRAGETMIELFPGTSGSVTSQARPEIWERKDEFNELALYLERFAGTVAEAGTDNPDELTDAMRMQPGTSMGGGSLLGNRGSVWPSADEDVPAEHAFHLMMETCASCHAGFRYRRE
jgi:cytochrome c556